MNSQPEPIKLETYHIFLASPGDMQEERQMVRKFFERHYLNISRFASLRFEVLDWEHFSNTGLGRPQELITGQTLQPYRKSLVLFIGLLGQRFGTATGSYESGTEEEFETVLQDRREHGGWPEIKWFFRKGWGKSGFPTDSVAMLTASEQLRQVEQFKQKLLQAGERQCYYQDFADTGDFEQILSNDLTPWLQDPVRPWKQIQRPEPVQQAGPVLDSAEARHYYALWQNLQAQDCARLPLELLDSRQALEHSRPVTLPDIFVPLKATPPSERWQHSTAQDLALAQEMAAGPDSKPVPVLELLNEQRLAVVIGDPGAGKSALVNQLAWLLSRPETTELPANLQGRAPLRLILRRVGVPEDARPDSVAWLWQAIENDIRAALENYQTGTGCHAANVLALLQQRLNTHPGGLILLDGLDEVPEAEQRREKLLQALATLTATLPECRFLLTARPYAYTDPRWRLKEFTPFFLTPFDADQREQFMRGWYQAARERFGLRITDIETRLPDLLERVENLPHLRELSARPLLLTLIATLHISGGRLPEDRARLYQDCVNLLLYRWRQDAGKDDTTIRNLQDNNQLLPCLQTLAYQAHLAQHREGGGDYTADITPDALFTAFAPLLEHHGQKPLLDFLQQHTGILIAREQQRFAFPHRSFQEYLAMGWLTGQSDDMLTPTVCDDPLWWREVFLLAVVEQRAKPRNALRLIADLQKQAGKLEQDSRDRLAVLSGLALAELQQTKDQEPTGAIREQIKDLLNEPFRLDVHQRAEAGRVLAELGDDRPGVGIDARRLPAIAWVKIPGGTVTLENNAGTFRIEDFYIARYPVTHRQFQAFIDAEDGYHDPRWWQGLDEQPPAPSPAFWPIANHPRETVSWFEAMAFCAWLSDKLGYVITLPSEYQWQQAATSGNPDSVYPWGRAYRDGYANINKDWNPSDPNYLGRASAVGIYPQGDSLHGVSDMVGNVWEWCLNSYNQPANAEKSGGFSRAVRGGSWIFGQDGARCTSRDNGGPDFRDGCLSFRVCCASLI